MSRLKAGCTSPAPFVRAVAAAGFPSGSGGGPAEDNVTGFLMRSVWSQWSKGSVLAVDAGSHLASIARILAASEPASAAGGARPDDDNNEEDAATGPARPGRALRRRGDHHNNNDKDEPSASASAASSKHGPFAGLQLPHQSIGANAAFITRELVSTYLITHPHLDHIAAFVINTPAFQHTGRPKRLAALPSTIDAFKAHIFNDVIWPNLSDEEGGVGLVSYMRLVEGSNVAIGQGDARGYIELCDGLGVKSWMVSHGACMRPAARRRDRVRPPELADAGAGGAGRRRSGAGLTTTTTITTTTADPGLRSTSTSASRSSSSSDDDHRHHHHLHQHRHPRHHHHHHRRSRQQQPQPPPPPQRTAYDSAAYFIRDAHTGRELLIFGDVEPDALSLRPRTTAVWRDAAPKIAAGVLRAIFIECSYDDSQPDETLFGHLAPRHLITELRWLADQVRDEMVVAVPVPHTKAAAAAAVAGSGPRPRKRKFPLDDTNGRDAGRATRSTRAHSSSSTPLPAQIPTPIPIPGPTVDAAAADSSHPAAAARSLPLTTTTTTAAAAATSAMIPLPGPLASVLVVIIHVKEPLTDAPVAVQDLILAQLQAHEADGRAPPLGCRFWMARSGGDLWL
ncbi:MAG: hypothetical protein M1826_005918 [Phylliscum demangeonii]|nr:MAG: hypothetical protein M1826_005918 [Phylliscum demangeonii]